MNHERAMPNVLGMQCDCETAMPNVPVCGRLGMQCDCETAMPNVHVCGRLGMQCDSEAKCTCVW